LFVQVHMHVLGCVRQSFPAAFYALFGRRLHACAYQSHANIVTGNVGCWQLQGSQAFKCDSKAYVFSVGGLQESNEAFDVLESALQNHPYFRTQAAAAAAAAGASAVTSPSPPGQQQQLHSPLSEVDVTPAAAAAYTAVGDGSGSSTPTSATHDGPSNAAAAVGAADAGVGSGASSSSGQLLVSMSAMLSAVRKDRSSFMDKVAEAVQKATPETPTQGSAGEQLAEELSRLMQRCCSWFCMHMSDAHGGGFWSAASCVTR
jgi:hypothetical protein